MPMYPVLVEEAKARGLTPGAMAKALDMPYKRVWRWLTGRCAIRWEEACLLQQRFFPDIEKDRLFSTSPQQGA
ncbi:hypothetical protein LJB76_01505 [Clostridia bacterium OttesenSCG-928-O13]|nr:hypothetical protein [Clostridia bacterium OttesenSCG-928-O13]